MVGAGTNRQEQEEVALTELMERAGLVLGMSEDEYHGFGEHKAFKTAEFSSTAAKKILQSPAHYRWTYIEGHSERKKAFDIGTAVHAKVLGVGAQAIAYPESVLSASGSIIAASKAWAEKQRVAGLVPVKQAELEQINAMAEAVLAHPDAGPALEAQGWPEASVFAVDPETGLPLRCRFDRLPEGHHVGLDLKKTAKGASLRSFTRVIEDLGYDVQHGHYVHTAMLAELPVETMAFIVVEDAPPYGVNVIVLDEHWAEMAKQRARRARLRYMRCIESGEWPAYLPGIKYASAPPWVVNAYQDEEFEDKEFAL